MIKARVLVPLVNPNEPEAQVADVFVHNEQFVDAQSVICLLETTKAIVEVTAPEAGFVRQLGVSPGGIVSAGNLICVITTSADEPVEEPVASTSSEPSVDSSAPQGLRITKPALALARQLGVEIAKLPKGPLVTKAVVRTLASAMPPSGDRSLPLTNARVLIYGGGGHAKAVIDLLRQAGTFHIAGIIDDRIPPGTTVLGVPVLGARELLPTVLKDGVRLSVNAVVSLSDFRPRIEIFSMLTQLGFAFPIVRHRHSVVEISAALEDGIQIFANAYVGSEAVLKQGCIINSGAVVSHECVIGEYSHITPGAMLAGGVRVGARTLVGMGVTTAVGIDIGNDVRIGNSALVYQDVPDRTIISAGSSWPAPRRVK